MFAVSGWAQKAKPESYLPELVKKAEAGDADAQYSLGVCYKRGAGVSEDEKEAVKWFTKAAEQRNAKAQLLLGQCFLNGWGVEINQKKGVEWITKSAEQGFAIAQYSLGV